MSKAKPEFIEQYDAMLRACEGKEAAFRTFVFLRNRAGESGEWRTGIETLAAELGIDRATVKRHIAWLRGRGYIRVTRTKRAHVNGYSVNWQAVNAASEGAKMRCHERLQERKSELSEGAKMRSRTAQKCALGERKNAPLTVVLSTEVLSTEVHTTEDRLHESEADDASVGQRIQGDTNTSPSLPASEASFVPLASPGARPAEEFDDRELLTALNEQRELGRIIDGHYPACAELRAENRHAACCCALIGKDAPQPLSAIALCGHIYSERFGCVNAVFGPCRNCPDEAGAA